MMKTKVEKIGKKFYDLPGKTHNFVIMTIHPIVCRNKKRKNYYQFEYHEFSEVIYYTSGGKKNKPKEVQTPPTWVIKLFEKWLESVKKDPKQMWTVVNKYRSKLNYLKIPRYKCKKCGHAFNWSAGEYNHICRFCCSPDIIEIEKKYRQGELF